MLLHSDPVIPLLILYPKEIIQKNNKRYICIKIFTATLSIIAHNENNLNVQQ